MDSYTIINDVQGISLLSIGIPLLRYPSGVNPKLTAATGFDISAQSGSNIVTLALLSAKLGSSYINSLEIIGWEYYTSTSFEFNNKDYRIPSIFMDLEAWPQYGRR